MPTTIKANPKSNSSVIFSLTTAALGASAAIAAVVDVKFIEREESAPIEREIYIKSFKRKDETKRS